MATPRVMATVGMNWTAVEGAAASVAGVTWQNVGQDEALIAFTTTAPAGGATDAVHLLKRGDMFYDKTGSAKVWARSMTPVGARLSASSD